MNTRKQIALTLSLSLLSALPAFASSAGSDPESGSTSSAQVAQRVRQGNRGDSERQPVRLAERQMLKEQREIHELARVVFEDGQVSQREHRILACRIAAVGGARHSGLSRYLKLHDEYGHF